MPVRSRPTWRVETRLPQLVRELETQALETEQARLQREREEAERQPVAGAIDHAALAGGRSDTALLRRGRGKARPQCGGGGSQRNRLASARPHPSRSSTSSAGGMPPDPETTPEALTPLPSLACPEGPERVSCQKQNHHRASWTATSFSCWRQLLRALEPGSVSTRSFVGAGQARCPVSPAPRSWDHPGEAPRRHAHGIEVPEICVSLGRPPPGWNPAGGQRRYAEGRGVAG
jgi:hypothetical protein